MKLFEMSLFKTSDTSWGIQSSHYDIFAEGKTILEAMENFQVSVMAELEYCKRYNVSLPLIEEAS